MFSRILHSPCFSPLLVRFVMNYIKILCVFLANRSLLTLVIVKHIERNLDTKKPRYSEHILPVPWPFVIQRVALCISQADSLYDGQVITKSYVASLHNFYQEITGFTRKFCSIQPNENCQFLTLFSCTINITLHRHRFLHVICYHCCFFFRMFRWKYVNETSKRCADLVFIF